MEYSYYCPLVAFGFGDIAYNKYARLLDCGDSCIQVYANKVTKTYICSAFIGIPCNLDSDGKLTYKPHEYNELLKLVEKYKTYNNITDDIKLEYAPVLSGDWKSDDSYYSLPDDNDEEGGEEECEK
jgi:hypothetical protein